MINLLLFVKKKREPTFPMNHYITLNPGQICLNEVIYLQEYILLRITQVPDTFVASLHNKSEKNSKTFWKTISIMMKETYPMNKYKTINAI